MTVTCTLTRYGTDAHEALARQVKASKAGDPLAAVTVVVPHNSSLAVAARRELARRGAVAAVAFQTPNRLAEQLASRLLQQQGRRPASTPVRAGLVRSVLHNNPGQFDAVRSHPGTERSLLQAYRSLTELTPEARKAIAAADPGAADVVRVHDEVRRGLRDRGLYDDPDLIETAVDALHTDPEACGPSGDLGKVIVFLPQRLSPSHARLLRAVGERHGLTVIAGQTGVEAADQAVREAVEAMGTGWPADLPQPPEQIAEEVLSVSDADDEVRHAVRIVVEAARDDIPLDRVAVLYGSQEPYARLLAAALDTAGIPWAGKSVHGADGSLLGRSLLAMLALRDHDFSRRDVCAWLSAAPVLVDRQPCPAAEWERASRAAGVVAGSEQWQQRLSALIEQCKAEAADLQGDEERLWLAEHSRREAGEAEELRAFVGGLAERLAEGQVCRTWEELAAWCRRLIEAYFGAADSKHRQDWPEHEQAAAQRVESAVEALGQLDKIDPQPSAAAFRKALRAQLEADRASRGKRGIGVYAGPISQSVGFEFERVVVLGMAEGSMPPKQRDDPLLPDRVRIRAGGELAPTSHDVHDLHRSLLAVMAASAYVTFTFPRGDLRRNAERVPSRWLLDCAKARDERRPAPERIARDTGDWFSEVPSFIAGMRRSGFAAHPQEYDVRAMLDLHESPDSATAGWLHRLDSDPLSGTHAGSVVESRVEVKRGLELLHGRMSSRFTRFDGNLAAGDLRGLQMASPTDPDQVVSASRLEAWAKCPHAYFVHHVLGVRHVEDPEEQHRISALHKGSALHEILEKWMNGLLGCEGLPLNDGPAFQDAVDGLLNIAEEHFRDLEQHGKVGRQLYWDRDQRVMKSDLRAFAEADRAMRAEHDSTPLALEWRFGIRGGEEPAAEINLGKGRSLRLRGAIDRIDQRADGTLHVIDYKTGRTGDYKKIDEAKDDPTLGGRFLQLGLYALAARKWKGLPDAEIRCDYWFVTRTGEFKRIGYEFSQAVEAVVKSNVAGIADGIAGGVFPLHPKAPKYRPGSKHYVDCHYCQPDGLGLAHQLADLRRKRGDKTIGGYLELIGENDA